VANPDDPKMRHISVAGGTYTILVSGEDTGGRYCLIDMLVPPAAARRRTVTTSRRCLRSWTARSSSLFRGKAQGTSAGSTVNIPANAPHAFKNMSNKPARLLCMCLPSGQEEFFMAVGDPVDSRTAPPPKLSDDERAERMQRARALSAKYRTELLV